MPLFSLPSPLPLVIQVVECLKHLKHKNYHQARSQENQIILLGLHYNPSILEVDHHPGRITLNVMGFQANNFANAKSGTVDGLQHNPVLEVVHARE